MKVEQQLCIKSFEITDDDGAYWKAEQGKTYTTSEPRHDRKNVTVFSNYWVSVPKEHFVLTEQKT